MKKLQKRLLIIGMLIISGVLLFNCINKVEIEKKIINTLSEANDENKETADNKKVNINTEEKNKNDDSNKTKNKEDNLDKKKNNVENNQEKLPNENINKSGEDVSISGENVEGYLNGTKGDDKKYVFLTFDDGPTEASTPDILKILKDKGVKATFFMIGNKIEKSDKNKELVKEVYDNGNAIGNHTYDHDYKKIYPGNSVDVNVFLNELDKTNNVLKNVLGNEFNTSIVRMPGGEMSRRYYKDPNLNNLKEEFKKRKIYSIDWNSLDGDAEGKDYTVQEMIDYVKRTSNGKNKVVILMHDAEGKHKTIEALPEIIDYFKENGYKFKTIKS